jgi:hypothetical protein
MATTTNYGWTTPDDTALVKDGAAAIRTLGSSVDTSVKALSPGTTAGDLDYYTTSTAKTRLGIGTTGQVLTVAAGVPSWAAAPAGMTLLSTTTLSGATTTISGISGSYKNLIAITFGVTNATADGGFQCAPNGSGVISTSTRNSNSTAISQVRDSFVQLCQTTNPMLRTNADNSSVLEITNYASTTAVKPFTVTSGYINSSVDAYAFAANGYIKTTSAITSLVFNNTGGNLSTGTVLLYGVN